MSCCLALVLPGTSWFIQLLCRSEVHNCVAVLTSCVPLCCCQGLLLSWCVAVQYALLLSCYVAVQSVFVGICCYQGLLLSRSVTKQICYCLSLLLFRSSDVHVSCCTDLVLLGLCSLREKGEGFKIHYFLTQDILLLK